MGSDFERNLWKFATLGVTAAVIGNIIVHARDVGRLGKDIGGVYVDVLRAINR